MTNKLLLATLAATAFVPAAAQAQRAPAAVVVVIDTDRIGRECTACRAAATQLQSQENALRTRAQTLQQQLAPEGQTLEREVGALAGKQPSAALQQRITAFQNKQRSAQQELANGQRNLASTQANVNQQISARLATIIQTVAQQRGANLALPKDTTVYAGPAVDVTNDVLAQLNRQLPSVSVTPLPQSQQQPQGR